MKDVCVHFRLNNLSAADTYKNVQGEASLRGPLEWPAPVTICYRNYRKADRYVVTPKIGRWGTVNAEIKGRTLLL